MYVQVSVCVCDCRICEKVFVFLLLNLIQVKYFFYAAPERS